MNKRVYRDDLIKKAVQRIERKFKHHKLIRKAGLVIVPPWYHENLWSPEDLKVFEQP